MADTIKIGNLEIDNLKVGTLSVDALYIGDVKIYPSTPTPPTPTLKWVSYSEGDAILLEGEKIYGFRIPTQVFYDVTDNETNFEISFSDGATAEPTYCVFAYSYDGGILFTINGESQTISYDPEVDDYLEIILSDYSSKQWYFGYMMYGIDQVTNFPFGMDFYEEDTPTPQTLQWVTFNSGDVIPSDLEIYGVSGLASNLTSTFIYYGDNIEFTDEGRGKCAVHIGWVEYCYCYEETGLLMSSNLEYIFSNLSNSCKLDSYTVSNGATVSGTIQLYIYA